MRTYKPGSRRASTRITPSDVGFAGFAKEVQKSVGYGYRHGKSSYQQYLEALQSPNIPARDEPFRQFANRRVSFPLAMQGSFVE
ncbi:hypothetical protein CVT26_009014 [Gymnopilus dilepis]|uniref:Uncharacterized protein n=1 Tax=Gymnopilus dilepis TaxID=231916 RepID=A0A409YR87_9AGAR|nr:hypothetical protein CVT26_009014 [Gymnopilus dilepis]